MRLVKGGKGRTSQGRTAHPPSSFVHVAPPKAIRLLPAGYGHGGYKVFAVEDEEENEDEDDKSKRRSKRLTGTLSRPALGRFSAGGGRGASGFAADYAVELFKEAFAVKFGADHHGFVAEALAILVA